MSTAKQEKNTKWRPLASFAWIDVQIYLDQEKARFFAEVWAKGWAKERGIDKAQAEIMARAQADGELDVVSKILEECGVDSENYNVKLARFLLKKDISVCMIAKLTTLTHERIYNIEFELRYPNTNELSE